MSKTFGAWLRDQTSRPDAVGDLARDYVALCWCSVCSNRSRRRPYTVDGLRRELDDHDAIPEAYDALDQAATEYERTPA